MNVNVRLSKTVFCFVVLVFNLSSVCHTIIHSSFGRLRNGWGIRPANHFYQCDGLKTSGSRFSLEVESVVSSYRLFIFWLTFWSNLLKLMALYLLYFCKHPLHFRALFSWYIPSEGCDQERDAWNGVIQWIHTLGRLAHGTAKNMIIRQQRQILPQQ